MRTALLKKCAEMFDVSPADILSLRRGAQVLAARRAFYLAMRMRGWSYAAIGRFMDRDHTTIMTGVQHAVVHAEGIPEYAEQVRQLAEYRETAA